MAKKPQVSPPAPYEQNTTNTTETEAIDTPDIQALRAFAPDTSMLSASLTKNFNDRRREIRDDYGAYTGIPSQVARNQLRDEALRGVDEDESMALAEGSTQAQALRMAQLETLARLTGRNRTTNTGRNYGYNTSVIGPQPSGVGGALSGAASVAGVAIPAILA